MATQELLILGHGTAPAPSGIANFGSMEGFLLTTNANLHQLGLLIPDPGAGDEGVYGGFRVPVDYVGTPELVITGILSGTPSSILAFGFGQTGGIGDSDTVNLPYETADLANRSVWTGYADEDYYEEVITITPAVAYVPGRKVFFFCYRNGAVDTATFDFIMDDLILRYSDT